MTGPGPAQCAWSARTRERPVHRRSGPTCGRSSACPRSTGWKSSAPTWRPLRHRGRFGTMKLTITRVLVREALHGIHLKTRNRNVIVADCHLYHNRGVGLLLYDWDLHQINVSIATSATSRPAAWWSARSAIGNLQISSCDIEANTLPNVLSWTAPAARAAFRRRWRSPAARCNTRAATTQPTSASSAAIWRRANGTWGHLTIANNVLSDVHVNVNLQKARGVNILGNTAWTGYEYNLRVRDSCERGDRSQTCSGGTRSTRAPSATIRPIRLGELRGRHRQRPARPRRAQRAGRLGAGELPPRERDWVLDPRLRQRRRPVGQGHPRPRVRLPHSQRSGRREDVDAPQGRRRPRHHDHRQSDKPPDRGRPERRASVGQQMVAP